MAVANPTIDTRVAIDSNLNGYSLYSGSSITGTFTNEGISCVIRTLTYFKIKNAKGVDVTNLFYAEGTSTDASYDTMMYNNGSFTYKVVAAGSTPTTVTFKQYEKNIQTLGNIPMGELTFNGVQSVTCNGTDYTKLVVDGTNYPPLPVMISFTAQSEDGTVTRYQAEEGMTWAEWIDSSYNTNGYIFDADGLVKVDARCYIDKGNHRGVISSENIIKDYAYTITTVLK